MIFWNLVVAILLSAPQILSARLGRSPKDIVKLDANENPYGPPPEVIAVIWATIYKCGIEST